VAGICNSVGGGVFLTCHRGGGAGGGGEDGSVSRLGLLIGNRWMFRFGYPGMPELLTARDGGGCTK